MLRSHDFRFEFRSARYGTWSSPSKCRLWSLLSRHDSTPCSYSLWCQAPCTIQQLKQAMQGPGTSAVIPARCYRFVRHINKEYSEDKQTRAPWPLLSYRIAEDTTMETDATVLQRTAHGGSSCVACSPLSSHTSHTSPTRTRVAHDAHASQYAHTHTLHHTLPHQPAPDTVRL